jgi:hypothetical protein
MAKKGEALEELVRHYFERQGFFALRSVPYRFGGEEITDVDVWLYHRPAASARMRAVVDVKSKKSPKALERVLWTKGLQVALRCDKAIVATTDTSRSVASFGRQQNVTVLTKSFLDRLEKNLEPANRLSLDELIEKINENRAHKQDGDWIKQLEASKSALISLAGFPAFNKILPAFSFYAQRAYTRPQFREQAVRCALVCAALACVALDTALEQLAFEDLANRVEAIQNGIAFGDTGDGRTKRAIEDVLAVISESMDNGRVVAVQAREKIMKRFEALRADIVAEYFSREHNAATLFNVARELDREAHNLNPPSAQTLSNESKSALGVFLDFVGIQRTYLLKDTNGPSDLPKAEAAAPDSAPKLL